MLYKKGDTVSRTDTEVKGVVTDTQIQNKWCPSDKCYRDCIGVQWESGPGSNFGPQWTPLCVIELEETIEDWLLRECCNEN